MNSLLIYATTSAPTVRHQPVRLGAGPRAAYLFFRIQKVYNCNPVQALKRAKSLPGETLLNAIAAPE